MDTTTRANRTLIVLNPNAGSGRAGKLWGKIEPILWRALGEMVVAITQHPEDVAEHLDKALAAGLTQVIAIGGDGTNHVLVNAMIRLQQNNPTAPRMTFGCIPVGTGQDWARTFGIPFDPLKAVEWITKTTTRAIDLGQVTTPDKAYHFLNVASVGISGDVSVRVNRTTRRRPWTFYRKTVESLLWYRPVDMR